MAEVRLMQSTTAGICYGAQIREKSASTLRRQAALQVASDEREFQNGLGLWA